MNKRKILVKKENKRYKRALLIGFPLVVLVYVFLWNVRVVGNFRLDFIFPFAAGIWIIIVGYCWYKDVNSWVDRSQIFWGDPWVIVLLGLIAILMAFFMLLGINPDERFIQILRNIVTSFSFTQ